MGEEEGWRRSRGLAAIIQGQRARGPWKRSGSMKISYKGHLGLERKAGIHDLQRDFRVIIAIIIS